jgi:hypothetical protein
MSAHYDLPPAVAHPDGDLAAYHHLSVDTHIAVAKSLPEGADDVEVPFRGDRIDLGCCTSAEARDMTVGTPPR